MWHDDLQLYLLSDSRDSVSLFDHVSGAAPAPPATADVSTRSQWLSRDATARLAIRNHLPATECAHFGEHRTAQALYDAVVARYSSPATAALGRLLLPYLFPELSAFATVADLVTHLRTSHARYRAVVPAEFLPTNQPPMFITLYFIVTRLPDSLRSVRDHFLTLDPTSLTVDLIEQHLLAAETSAVADVGAASTSTKRRNSKGKGGRGSGGGNGGGGGGRCRRQPPAVMKERRAEPPSPSCPAPSVVSHVTPQSSPLQRLVPVMSGGGVGVEVTPVEDTAASNRRPRPASPPGFLSVLRFPPRSSLRQVAAEPGGVSAGGIGGTGGVGGGSAGSGGAGAGGTSIVAPTPCTVPAGGGAASVAASREGRGGAIATTGESKGGVTSAAAGAVAAATRESRGVTATAPSAVSVPAGEGRAGVPTAAAGAVARESRGRITPAAGEGRGGATREAAGAGAVAADARGGGAAATARLARLCTSTLGSWSSTVSSCSPLSRAVSPKPRRFRYRTNAPFHLVLRSRVPPPPVLP
ncbi:unnamed protein product [Closterium sp. NIES-53]